MTYRRLPFLLLVALTVCLACESGPECVIDTDCPVLATRCVEGACAIIGEARDSGPRTDSGPGMDGGARDGSVAPVDAFRASDAATVPRADPDPGEITCGAATCFTATGEICCLPLSASETPACADGPSCVRRSDIPVACDGPEDCTEAGRACCAPSAGATVSGGFFCTDTCPTDTVRVCTSADDCSPGEDCVSCRPMIGAIVGLCGPAGTCPSGIYEPEM